MVNPGAFSAVPLPQASFWNFTGTFLSQDLVMLDGSQEGHKNPAMHRLDPPIKKFSQTFMSCWTFMWVKTV